MDTAQPLAFGTLLRRHRLAAGLTQEELAERVYISRRSVSDMERGVPHCPRPETVALLATALELSEPDHSALVEAARRLRAAPSPSTTHPHPVPAVRAAPPFVGRTRELALLERHLAGEGPPVLLLAGEPGIGKSRLLQAAVPRAVGSGWCVLEGGCQRRGGHEPYAPLLGALQRHIRGQRPGQLRAELQGCAWLVRLLPELADGLIEPLPAWTLSPAQEYRLMGEAVLRFLANVAGPAGTLLVLDDLQWAGPDALDLLATLARSAAEVPLRVIGAYRDTEVQAQDPLSIVLADLAHAGLAARRLLGPLAPEEAAQLLDGLLGGGDDEARALRAQVLQRAGGVPFFVVSCAQVVQRDELEERQENAVPWDVAQSVRQRVAALPEGAREVLGVAAVVGRVVPSALLAGAAARPEEEVVAAFDAACQARLLEQQGEEAYQFAHDVIREVVEADLGAARRRLLHRRVAEMLEREPGDRPIELLAYHYARSSEREKALPYVEQAGDRAMAQYANASAVAYYQELVDRLEGMGRSQDAAAAREKLGAVFFTMARYDAALAVFGQAEEAYRAVGDLGSVGRVAVQIGDVHHERGTPDEGLAHIQPLLDALDEHSPPAGSETLYQVLAHLYFASRRYARQLAAADRAADLARSAGNDWVLADAENDRGLALLLLGRPEEALPFLGRAAQLAQAVGNLNTLNWALSNTGSAYLRLGELEMARRYMERALELAERRGNLVQSAFQTYLHGLISFFGGDWGQAHLAIERAAAVSQECGPSWAAAYPVYGRGLLCLVTGEWDAAAHHLEECKAVAVRSGGRGYAEAEGALAWRDLLAGCPETALARLAPLLESLGQEAVVTDLLPLLAWAHLEAGALEEASAVAAQAIRQAEAQNARRSLADALWVQARVALRQGHREGAAQGLEEGLMLVRRMPYPYGEARLLEVYGDLHVQMGEIPTARERLEAALAIVKQLGAHKDAERIAQGIAHRANGARPSAGRARRAGHRRRG